MTHTPNTVRGMHTAAIAMKLAKMVSTPNSNPSKGVLMRELVSRFGSPAAAEDRVQKARKELLTSEWWKLKPDQREKVALDDYLEARMMVEAAPPDTEPDWRGFILRLLEDHWEGDCNGVEIEGGEFQDIAEAYRILIPVKVTEPCHEGCFCSCYANIPGTCYRPHPGLERRG